MDDKISVLHKVLLWLCIISSSIFGVGQYLFPGPFTAALKIDAPDLIAIAAIGGFLIAAVMGAALSLKSCLWSEVRITTYYLMTWCLLNGIRMGINMIIKNDISLMPNTVLCLILGIGFACVAIKRKSLSK